MKLRIATVGTVRAKVAGSNTVPSPTIESFIEGVRDPRDRSGIVKQEIAFGDKPAPSAPVPSSAPAPPDMADVIRKQRS